MKFLVDMPLPPALAHWLEARGHDAVHASTLDLDRASDAEILARAAQDMRTVVTVDLDYPRLLALAAAAGPGLILFRRGDWSEADEIVRMQQIRQSKRGRCNADHYCYRARSSTSTFADILTATDEALRASPGSASALMQRMYYIQLGQFACQTAVLAEIKSSVILRNPQ